MKTTTDECGGDNNWKIFNEVKGSEVDLNTFFEKLDTNFSLELQQEGNAELFFGHLQEDNI